MLLRTYSILNVTSFGRAAPWAPAAISYAERLVYLPLGIVATAFATVLLPTLAGRFAHDDLDGAKTTLVTSIEDVLLLAIPAAAGLMLLSHDIVTIAYQGGAFQAQDALRVASVDDNADDPHQYQRPADKGDGAERGGGDERRELHSLKSRLPRAGLGFMPH